MEELLSEAPRRKENLYIDSYPESWYAVAQSKSLAPGKIEPVEAFGQKMVLYRTQGGEVRMTGRFCPHYGASFQTGKVIGSRIACPFHGWEYDRGVCVRIPYQEDKKIPPGARVPTMHVREHLGWIWVWNGKEPTFELPDLAEHHDKKYGYITKSQWFDVHPLTILENGCDVQHFKFVHRSNFESYEVEILRDEPHDFEYSLRQWCPAPFGKRFSIDTTIRYIGGSIIYGTLGNSGKKQAAFIASPLPVSFKHTHFHLMVYAKRLPTLLRPLDRLWIPWFADRIFTGSTDDYEPIWRHMDTNHRGVLVAEDALQQRFHRFYRSHLAKDAVRRLTLLES